jgi:hypothetical protein
MEFLQHYFKLLLFTLRDILPIVLIIFGFQIFVIRRRIPNLKRVLVGFVYMIIGLPLFLVGLEEALFPLGRLMAGQLTATDFIGATGDSDILWHRYYWVYIFAAALVFSTAMAEPALMAVAMKADDVSGGAIRATGLRVAVAFGAAIGTALGTFRIVTGLPLHYFIAACYVIIVVQTFFAPRSIIALAYDSGGVTTSTVTVPLVAALGLGLASSVPGRSPLLDGFGLIAFTCMFPIMSVLAYAQLAELRKRR